jgi:hypothetical protein
LRATRATHVRPSKRAALGLPLIAAVMAATAALAEGYPPPPGDYPFDWGQPLATETPAPVPDGAGSSRMLPLGSADPAGPYDASTLFGAPTPAPAGGPLRPTPDPGQPRADTTRADISRAPAATGSPIGFDVQRSHDPDPPAADQLPVDRSYPRYPGAAGQPAGGYAGTVFGGGYDPRSAHGYPEGYGRRSAAPAEPTADWQRGPAAEGAWHQGHDRAYHPGEVTSAPGQSGFAPPYDVQPPYDAQPPSAGQAPRGALFRPPELTPDN